MKDSGAELNCEGLVPGIGIGGTGGGGDAGSGWTVWREYCESAALEAFAGEYSVSMVLDALAAEEIMIGGTPDPPDISLAFLE